MGASRNGLAVGGAEAVISARGVGKRFLVYHQRATSLKERLVQTKRVTHEEFWALRDVNLEIGAGQTVGLIGANGSGKSTLLKLLAGILEPTCGKVAVRGRVSSLLELGAGFNPELSGRDNIYLNASILGLSRRETERAFDDIVAFSGLEQFIDNQIKHYSSGQYVRLGFSVAAHVDPDILLVDEVLAVGDEAFQKKCLDKIAEFQARGCTILFVTHALDLVPKLCSRAVVLDHGRVLHDGDPLEAAEKLRSLLGTAADQTGGATATTSSLRISGARLYDPATVTPKGEYRAGEPMGIEIDVTAGAEPPEAASVRLAVTGPADVPMWVMDTEPQRFEPGQTSTVRFTVKELPPIQGIYAFAVALRDPVHGVAYDARRFGEAFRALGADDRGLVDVAWTVERGKFEQERNRAKPPTSRGAAGRRPTGPASSRGAGRSRR
jgi:ABC-2 type transport system ATP-binding protein